MVCYYWTMNGESGSHLFAVIETLRANLNCYSIQPVLAGWDLRLKWEEWMLHTLPFASGEKEGWYKCNKWKHNQLQEKVLPKQLCP